MDLIATAIPIPFIIFNYIILIIHLYKNEEWKWCIGLCIWADRAISILRPISAENW